MSPPTKLSAETIVTRSTLDCEYEYEAFDSANRSLTRNSGSFRPDNDASNNAANRGVRHLGLGRLQRQLADFFGNVAAPENFGRD